MNMIPRMSRYRCYGVLVYVALILFSATPAAGNSSHFAYLYYTDLLGIAGTPSGLHYLAQKCIHFILFFGLGCWLTNGIEGSWVTKCCWSIAFCFFVGTSSEFLESFFPERTAAIFDVILNTVSGALGSFVIWSERCRSRMQPEQLIRQDER